MQKRARLIDNKIKRLHINRRVRADVNNSLSLPLAYMRLTCLWMIIVALDAITGVRIELLWPFWLMIRSAYESMHKNQHAVASFANPHTARFSVFFVCVTATSDLICYLFIPVRILIFIATTYVWMNLIWHTQGGFIRAMNTLYGGDRSQSWLILLLSTFVIIFEIFVRAKCDLLVYISRDQSFSYYLTPGVSPVLPRSLNAFFGAHCIGYPVVLVTFSLHHYFNEWKMRRRQNEVASKNEVLYRMLVESLPSIYEGPKDYSTQCIEEDIFLLEPSQPIVPPMAITGPMHSSSNSISKKNGFHKNIPKRGKKTNGVSSQNSTPPIEKKKKDRGRGEEMEENEDSEADEYGWQDNSLEERRSGGVWIIRFMCDFAAWTFSMFGGFVGGSVPRQKQSVQNNRSYTEAVEEDEDDQTEMNESDRKTNGRLNSDASKNRANTLQITTNRQQQPNTNKRCSVAKSKNEKLVNGNFSHSNGHSRSTTVRDSSHDTTGSNETEIRTMTREMDSMRAELNSKRNLEEDLRLQISMLESSESSMNQTISHLNMRIDQMENKCSSLEKHRESDKASLEQSEKKYADLVARKAELECALIAERKARNDDTGKKMDLAEHQREKERQLEKEVDRLRAELKVKEDTAMSMDAELSKLRNYKEENDIDALNLELRILKDKSSHLEASLASENKLKLELFRALGDAKASNKALENRVKELENQLRNRRQTTSERNDDSNNSGHQNNSSMPSTTPTKVPLSVAVNSRGSPFQDKLSPVSASQHSSVSAAPPDYHMAVNHPKPASNSYAYRYNQFQPQHASTGEHLLFDVPPPRPPSSSSPTCAALGGQDSSRHMGKFGAPNPITRTN